VPRDEPELPFSPPVVEKLAWYSPLTWIGLIRRVRRSRAVVFTVVTPFHAVPYIIPVLALRKRQRYAVVHNVVPHESSLVDRLLMKTLLRRMARVFVHSDEQRALALDLGVAADALVVLHLPDPGISAAVDVTGPPALTTGAPVSLLFFGMIRRYKGLDVLLSAVARSPSARLRIAGHFWEPLELYTEQITALGIADRVEIEPGYVSASRIPQLFAEADVLVLPYRSGTASIVMETAYRFGRPVIVTSVGTLAAGVEEGGLGIVVPAEDAAALAEAIETVSEPSVLERMHRAALERQDPEEELWSNYADALRAPEWPA